jgi:hypothetical protein
VSAGAIEISGDPAWCTWDDVGLVGGVEYRYAVVAVRAVRVGPEPPPSDPPTPPPVIRVAGPPSPPVIIRGMDLTVPAAPLIVAAEWVDAAGDVASAAAIDARARLTIRAAATTARVLVQRRTSDSDVWTNPPVNGTRGWQPWPSGVEEAAWIDSSADPTRRWTYQILMGTVDGRQSAPSAAVDLPPL